MNNIEEMRKRMAEIQQKNDAYLAKHVPGYDPEKAKASREKLRSAAEKRSAERKEKSAAGMEKFREHMRQMRKK